MSTSTVLPRGAGTTGTCTYDLFEIPVGEPRGVEYTAVLTLFWHCLALFGAVGTLHGRLTGFRTRFTELFMRFPEVSLRFP